jgi:hypothetical protein
MRILSSLFRLYYTRGGFEKQMKNIRFQGAFSGWVGGILGQG